MTSFLGGLFKEKCPRCRHGNIFVHKHVFPLKGFLKTVDTCPACGQKMQLESYRGGGVNYAITMVLFFLNALWYAPIFGISYKDNSFYYFILTSVGVVVAVQPWLMRLSWVIYLYMLVHYDEEVAIKAKEQK